MTDTITITPVRGPVLGTVRPPGSKSLTNRALIVAALARGASELTGVLDSQDTRVMVESLRRLGIELEHDAAACTIDLTGCAGRPAVDHAELWLENSGTSIRFLTALCTLGDGRFRLDGNTRMRERPIGPLVEALRQLDVDIVCELGTDCPPVQIAASGLPGGTLSVGGNLSSQYLSALLMAAPCAKAAINLKVDGTLVSRPYVDMTLEVMRAFGARVEEPEPGDFILPPGGYQGRSYDIEPDASAASYFFAAAAITGGEVTVEGLSRDALQGDVGFVDVLVQMGCEARWEADSITLVGKPLRGVDVDMNAISDTAQTLAAVAPFASGPTRIRNVAHMRHKETDRVAAVVNELRRLGLEADEHEDGLTIHPGPMQPADIETYDDHRMAMSFALVGLRHPGVGIKDPGCTVKTYPDFFDDLEGLCRTAR
ncbi:3-phosphoshikimate 1-carboxyvinyltransferase [Maioricimonas rarisocia]|nr:3-phosphoshikimate 1-carboxyvinyltransferase [Maioricimonas rarisocia]